MTKYVDVDQWYDLQSYEASIYLENHEGTTWEKRGIWWGDASGNGYNTGIYERSADELVIESNGVDLIIGSSTGIQKIAFASTPSDPSYGITLTTDASGSLIFAGSAGNLFSITDNLVGSLMSVSAADGIPIFEVFSTDRIVMGEFGLNTLVVDASNVAINQEYATEALDVSGNIRLATLPIIGTSDDILIRNSTSGNIEVRDVSTLGSGHALNTHLDVSTSTVTTGSMLYYDGINWIDTSTNLNWSDNKLLVDNSIAESGIGSINNTSLGYFITVSGDLRVGSVSKWWNIDTNGTGSIWSQGSNSMYLSYGATSSTVPNFIPNRTDLTTGLGGAVGTLSLTTGGIEAIHINVNQDVSLASDLIITTGNINIGVWPTSNHKLNIKSDGAALSLKTDGVNGSSGSKKQHIDFYPTADMGIPLSIEASAGLGGSSFYTGGFIFKTSDYDGTYVSREALTIISKGWVGILDTIPEAVFTVAPNTDASIILGRTRFDTRYANQMLLSHYNMTSTAQFAIKQNNAGQTSINSANNNVVALQQGGTTSWQVDGTGDWVGSTGNSLIVDVSLIINTLPQTGSALANILVRNNTSGEIEVIDSSAIGSGHILDSHSDVSTSTVETGSMLFNDGTNWIDTDSSLTWAPSTALLDVGGRIQIGTATNYLQINQIGGGTQFETNSAKNFYFYPKGVYTGGPQNGGWYLQTKVGINETVPVVALEVVGDVSISGINFEIAADQDASIVLGKIRIDSRSANRMYLSHYDMTTTSNFALRQLNTGATALNAASGTDILFSINNSTQWRLTTAGHLQGVSGSALSVENADVSILGTGQLHLQPGSTSAPSLTIGGPDSGLYSSSADSFKVVLGGTATFSFFSSTFSPATNGTTQLGGGGQRWGTIYSTALATGTTAANINVLQAYDTGASTWKVFATLTAGTSPSFLIDGSTTAITQSGNDNTTALATTAYVDTTAGNYLPLSGGDLTGQLTIINGGLLIGSIGTPVDSSFYSNVYVHNDLIVGGDFTVDGSVFIIGTETLDVSAAFIYLNTGVSGPIPSSTQSGLVIDRGDSSLPYVMIYDESTQDMRIGFATETSTGFLDSSTMAVATREDSPFDTGLAIWDNPNNKFRTDTSLYYSNSGNLSVSPDTVTTHIFGKAQFGIETTDWVGFRNIDAPTYAIRQHTGGWTTINTASSTSLQFSVNDVTQWAVDSTGDLVGSIGNQLIVADNSTNTEIILGSARITTISDTAYFSHYNNANNTDYAINQASNGLTSVSSKSGQSLILAIGGATQWTINSTGNLVGGANNDLTVGAGADLFLTKTPNTSSEDAILVWNSSTKAVQTRDVSTLGSGHTLDAHYDVSTASAIAGSMLYYDSVNWIDSAANLTFDGSEMKIGLDTKTVGFLLDVTESKNETVRIGIRNDHTGTSARTGLSIANGIYAGNSAHFFVYGQNYSNANQANRLRIVIDTALNGIDITTSSVEDTINMQIANITKLAIEDASVTIESGVNLVTSEQILGNPGTLSTPTYSFTSSPSTGFYETGSDGIAGTFNGVQKFLWLSNGDLYSSLNNGYQLATRNNATSGTPTFIPNQGNSTTGIGGASGTISLIISGTEAILIDAARDVTFSDDIILTTLPATTGTSADILVRNPGTGIIETRDISSLASAHNLDGHGDVSAGTVAIGSMLYNDGVNWIDTGSNMTYNGDFLTLASNKGIGISGASATTTVPLNVNLTAGTDYVQFGPFRYWTSNLNTTFGLINPVASDGGAIISGNNSYDATASQLLLMGQNEVANHPGGGFILKAGITIIDVSVSDSIIEGQNINAGSTVLGKIDGGNIVIDGGTKATAGNTDGQVILSSVRGRTLVGDTTNDVSSNIFQVSPDTDVSIVLGRARIDSRSVNATYFSHYDFLGSGDYAIRQTVSGLTQINSASTGNLILSNQGSTRWTMIPSGDLSGASGASFTVDASLFLNATPATGTSDDMVIWNSTTKALEIRDVSTLGSGHALNTHIDVSTATASVNDMIYYDGINWINTSTMGIGIAPSANSLIYAFGSDSTAHVTTSWTPADNNIKITIENNNTGVVDTGAYISFITSPTTVNNAISYIGSISPTSDYSELVFGIEINNSIDEVMRLSEAKMTAFEDTDASIILGRGRIDSRNTDRIAFSHYDQSGVNSFAIEQFAGGETRVNAAAGTNLRFLINAATAWYINSNRDLIGSANNSLTIDGSLFLNVTPSTGDSDSILIWNSVTKAIETRDVSTLTTTFNDITDVSTSGATIYDMLYYDGINWIDSSTNMSFDGTTFSATAKSFKIKHPDPERTGFQFLQYGSVESPEHSVLVRGKIDGKNVIELPNYWKKLVDEESITVQLTSRTPWNSVYVKDVSNNTVTIGKVGFGRINAFYTVNGERKDIPKLKVEY